MDLVIRHTAKFQHLQYGHASNIMQQFNVVIKQTQHSPDAIIRSEITRMLYAAFHSSRELVFTRSRDPGNHEFGDAFRTFISTRIS